MAGKSKRGGKDQEVESKDEISVKQLVTDLPRSTTSSFGASFIPL